MCLHARAWRPARRGRLPGGCVLALACWALPCAAQPPPGAQHVARSVAQAESELPAAPGDVASGAGAHAVARFLLERAKERFNRGVLERDAEQLERALDALLLGRSLAGDPALSFNAARVARELGRCADARALYQSFLASETNAERRARAEHQLAELGACDSSEPSERVLPGVSLPLVAAPAERSFQAPLLWGELETAAAPSDRAGTPPWLWGLVGGAGLCAVLSGVSLVQAGARDGELERFRPDPADPDAAQAKIEQLQSDGRAAQTRARIFGGVGAGLGVSAAIGYWLTARSGESPASELRLRASGGALQASWRTRF